MFLNAVHRRMRVLWRNDRCPPLVCRSYIFPLAVRTMCFGWPELAADSRALCTRLLPLEVGRDGPSCSEADGICGGLVKDARATAGAVIAPSHDDSGVAPGEGRSTEEEGAAGAAAPLIDAGLCSGVHDGKALTNWSHFLFRHIDCKRRAANSRFAIRRRTAACSRIA
eukprot:6258047-Prymnesium_polylepis.1